MVLLAIAAMCGYFVKGITGFANTLVFSTIAGFGGNNVSITPLELVPSSIMNGYQAWHERKYINMKFCLPFMLTMYAFDVPGSLILRDLGADVVKIIFGFVIIFVAADMWRNDAAVKKKAPSKLMIYIMAAVSGILSGMFGIGVMLCAVLGRAMTDNREFRASTGFIFTFENMFRLVLYAVIGIYSLETLKTSVILLPCICLGYALGMLLRSRLNEETVRKLVIIMLMISGAALVINCLA